MFPSADLHSSLFFFGLLLASVISFPLHELGHVLAGRLAGYRNAACGVGFPGPFFRFRLGGTSFYLGKPLLGGMTLPIWEGFPSARSLILFNAGGPLANLALGGAALILWDAGLRSGFVSSAWYVSVVFFLWHILPFTFTASGARFRSDGLLIAQAWRGTWRQWDQSGDQIAALKALRGFCRELDSLLGEVHYTLLLAWHEVKLFDVESAQETLRDECLLDPRRGLFGQMLEAVVHAVIAVETEPSNACVIIDGAKKVCSSDSAAQVILLLAHASAALNTGLPAASLAREALAGAREIKDPLLETAAMALIIQADPPEDVFDVLDACREILSFRGSRKATPLIALNLLCWVMKILAAKGHDNAVRVLFQEVFFRLTAIARRIPAGQQRERLVSRVSSWLQGELKPNVAYPVAG